MHYISCIVDFSRVIFQEQKHRILDSSHVRNFGRWRGNNFLEGTAFKHRLQNLIVLLLKHSITVVHVHILFSCNKKYAHIWRIAAHKLDFIDKLDVHLCVQDFFWAELDEFNAVSVLNQDECAISLDINNGLAEMHDFGSHMFWGVKDQVEVIADWNETLLALMLENDQFGV